MHCEIIYRHFNLFVCRNTTEKSKLEKCYSDNKVWAPKCYNGLSNDLDKSLHVSLIKFSCWSKLHVNIITGLELRELSFTRDLPVIQKSEIPLSEFCPISGDWDELGILNLAQMSLMKSYWMLQNARVTAFTFSELWK